MHHAIAESKPVASSHDELSRGPTQRIDQRVVDRDPAERNRKSVFPNKHMHVFMCNVCSAEASKGALRSNFTEIRIWNGCSSLFFTLNPYARQPLIKKTSIGQMRKGPLVSIQRPVVIQCVLLSFLF